MGRTKRKRKRKHIASDNSININNEQSIINLKQWMTNNPQFVDPLKLQLREFPLTGRGLTSKHSVEENDVLLRIPLNLLITFDTVHQSGLLEYFHVGKISIISILILFLVMEKHKGNKSLWKYYISTLPDPEPQLPWICPDKFLLEYFPSYLQTISQNLQSKFLYSFTNLKRSIDSNVLCCCGCKKTVVCVLDKNLFKWAYVLVNTRAVYINPKFISTKTLSHLVLSDEPCIALCPYLDMFNHHYQARTEARIITMEGNQLFYELKTLIGFKKYSQFFISYGAHDNIKLFLEYGFFIPNNEYDSIDITLDEVLKVLDIQLSPEQYKFIVRHYLNDKHVCISTKGPSYNLEAILFIAFYPKVHNYAEVIYGENYPEDFLLKVNNAVRKLLEFKFKEFNNDVLKLRNSGKQQTTRRVLELLNDFLEYKLIYVKDLLANYNC